MNCPNCGTSVGELVGFCPNCGTSLSPAAAGFPPRAGAPSPSATGALPYTAATSLPLAYSGVPEERVKRVVGYLIDVVPMLVLALLHFLPVVGWMLYGLLHILYWLLRDINGASIGKTVMGSYVADVNGGPSTTSQRITRNIPLAIPGLFGLIPLLGIIFEIPIALLIFVGEAALLLLTGRRFGDRLAGTTVLRK